MYEYSAQILSIHDGDTVRCDVDLGCDVHTRLTIRLYGINAPELATDAGKAALGFLQGMVAVGDVITLQTVKDHREKYGRYLGTLIKEGGIDVNAAMIAAGHASTYYGEGPKT